MLQQQHLLTQFQSCTENQDDLVCLVLTDFPKNINLIQVKQSIQQEFPYIIKVEIHDQSRLECYFQSMTDLIQIDQGKKFGAAKAYIKQKTIKQLSLSQTSRKKLQNLVDEFQKNFNQNFVQSSVFKFSLKQIPLKSFNPIQINKVDYNVINFPRFERLTSLQDEVQELENLRQKLNLFNSLSQKDHDMTFQTDHDIPIQKCQQSQISTKHTVINDNNQQDIFEDNKNKQVQKKQIIKSIFEGIIFSGIIYGGLKIIKSLIK